MKTQWLFILLLLPLLSSAQESRFSIGIQVNPGVSDRMFISDGSPGVVFVEEVFSKIEKSTFGYDAGVIVEYKINEKFRLQSGVNYVKWGYESDRRSLFFTFEPEPTLPEATKNEGENTYLEIPLSLSYHLNFKQGSLFFLLGSSMAYNLKNTNKMILFYPDRTEVSEADDEMAEFRKINFTNQLGIGLERTLNSTFSVFIMPNFKIQTFAIAKDVPLNRRLFFYGVSFGVKVN